MDLCKKKLSYQLGCCLAAAAILILAVLSVSAANEESSLTIQIAQFPHFLDPARISTYEEKLLCGALYETLLSYNPTDGSVQGVLADKWEVDGSGRVYTFVLRKGLRFHHGEELTARDVKFSWERLSDPEISSYGYLLQNVRGAKEYSEGKSSDIKGLRVINDRTLQVKLLETDYTFPALVSSPVLGVVSRNTAEKMGKDYGQKDTLVVGTGPFSLSNWGSDQITLVKNNKYKGTPPRSKSLQFIVTGNQQEIKQLLADGKIDILTGVTPQFANTICEEGKGKVISVKKPVLSFYFLGFNLEEAPFGQNVELRRAVDQALDNEKLALSLLGDGSKPLNGLLPPELLRKKDKKAKYADRKTALNCLAASGHPFGSRLSPLTLAYNNSSGHETLARLVREELGRVGIVLALQQRPWDEYKKELAKGRYPFFRLGWEADYPEAGNILYYNFACGEEHNFTRYSCPEFDTLLKKARCEQSFQQRQEIYCQAEKVLLNDLPVVPLFQRVAVFVLTDRVEGFNIDLLGMIDFKGLDKDKEMVLSAK
ncbi:MAG: ABC transporter substrate-binding protein [Thermoanaerobacterales bacterium]|nr:ABC transporter substrate-binding protein [Thermoanaerobacterales bacterium]